MLSAREHKMGAFNRPMGMKVCHALFHSQRPVGIAITASLIMPNVGGVDGCTRENTIELARVRAERRDLNRVVLRLWREFVFPGLGKQFAISYQDAALHSGDLYRFDGWKKAGFSNSGTDRRSGRPGRDKWVWLWEAKQHPRT